MAWYRLASLVLAACSVVAAFNETARSNVAVYYGQGPNQKRLSTYCADNNIDIIVLSFVHLFPQQANGYPGINFGNQCSDDRYAGPGAGTAKDPSKDNLLKCPDMQKDLQLCRQTDKKVLLSLGGATPDYQLNGPLDGMNFATQLWGMFGPRQSSWVAQGLPRPFDDGGVEFSVDGFDLDIEHPPIDGFAGYKALVTQLRALYDTVHGTYYLTASPQCVVPDANMAEILRAAAFDMVFVQFYNTPECSARRWADANSNYVPGGSVNSVGFTFDSWVSFLATTPYNRDARVYIGVPGSAAAAIPGNDVSSQHVHSLAAAHYCRPNFGGIAIWEATAATGNVENGRNFFENAKESLRVVAADIRISCAASSSPPPPPPLPLGQTPSPPQSTDGRCGDGFGTTCGSAICCSRWNWCGTGQDHCGAGCQKGFGRCAEN